MYIDLIIQKLILKGFWVDNICSVSFLGCANVQILVAPYTRTSYIELPMGKARLLKVESNNLEGLTLRFVDEHCKTQLDWKLQSLELVHPIRRYQGDSRDKDVLVFVAASDDCGLKDVRFHRLDHQPSAITEARGIQISQQHDWCTYLQDQIVCGHTRWLLRI